MAKNTDSDGPNVGGFIALGLFIVICLVLIVGSFYVIDAGQEGVVLTWGSPSADSVGPGLHFKWPVAQSVVKYDVQTLKYESAATAASKDLQDVHTNIAVNFHLLPSTVPTLHREIGKDYATKLIQPTVQDSVKAATAVFTAEQLITQRPMVREKILSSLRERLNPRGIVVEDISITNFEFSDSFTAAIEAKVTAEQQKLKAANDLERIKIEAEQVAAQGQGEADAILAKARAEAEEIRLKNQELQQSPQYVELIKWQRWNGELPQWYMVGDNGGTELLVQVPQEVAQ